MKRNLPNLSVSRLQETAKRTHPPAAGRTQKPNVPALHRASFYALISLALAGPPVFQLTSTVVSFLHKGYSLIRDAVSILVFGPYGWLQTAGFYFFGISLLSLSIILLVKTRVKINAGAVLLALVGIGFVVIGAYKGQGPGGPLDYSGLIHRITVGMVVVTFPVACFLLAPSLKAWGHPSIYIYTIAVGIFAMLFIIIGGPILALQYSLPGIFERVLLWNGQLWLLVICVHLVSAEVQERRERSIPAPVDF